MAFGISDRLAILITADGQGAVKELENVGKAADRELGKLEKSPERIAASLTKTGAAFLTFGGVAAAGLFQAAQSASDLDEAVNLTQQTFGSAADEIGDFAAGAATAMGMSETAAREATAQIGGLLTNLGFAQDETVEWSKTLAVLGSDLASAFNTDPAEAVAALGAALRGETEPIRRFNVMLDDASVRAKAVEMGLADTTAEVDRHGKAQATLALIMEQTASVQGDFARTADGAANAQRIMAAQFENMKASIGEAALPILTALLGVANDMLGAFMSLNEATGGLIGQLAVIGTGAALAVGSFSLAAGAVLKLKNNVDGLLKLQMAAKIGAWGPALGIAGVAVGALAFGVWQLGENGRESAARIDALTGAMRDTGSAAEGTLVWVNDLVTANGDLVNMLGNAEVSTAEFSAALLEGGPALQAMKDELFEAARAAGAGETEIRLMNRVIDQLALETEKAAEKTGELNTVVAETADATSIAAAEMGILAAGVQIATGVKETYIAALEAEEEKLRAAEEATRALTDAVLAALNAEIGHAQAVNRTEDALAAYQTKANDAEASTEDLERAQLNAQSAALRQAEAALKLAEDQATANGVTLTAADRNRILQAELQKVADKANGPLRAAIQGMIDKLGEIPPNVTTELELLGYDSSGFAVAEYSAMLGAIPRSVHTNVHTSYTSSGNPGQLPGGTVGGFFPGGGFMGNAGSVVSPDGHRLAALLPGEMVLNKGQQSAVLGMIEAGAGGGKAGASIVNHFDLHVHTLSTDPHRLGDDVVDALRVFVGKNGPLTGITTT